MQESKLQFKKPTGGSLLLLGSFFGVSGGFLGSCLSLASHVEVKLGVLGTDWLDQTLLVKVLDEGSGNGTTNLEFLAENGSGDAENFRNLLNHSLVLLVLEEDGVVKLFLYLDLGPGLLFGFTSLGFSPFC